MAGTQQALDQNYKPIHGSAELYDPTGAQYVAAQAGTVSTGSDGTLYAVQKIVETAFFPSGATTITADSGNVANATATATLAGTTGKTTYITGFMVTASGATAASVVTGTITGVITGTQHFTFVAPAGATVAAQPLIVNFAYPIPASATNTGIAVALPALGSGNTNATVSATGFQM